jgi:hypothetical protein
MTSCFLGNNLMKGMTMANAGKILLFGLLVLTLASCAGMPAGNGTRAADGNWGPATSVPQIYMTANGDRVGPYPPYYYPDGTSGRER